MIFATDWRLPPRDHVFLSYLALSRPKKADMNVQYLDLPHGTYFCRCSKTLEYLPFLPKNAVPESMFVRNCQTTWSGIFAVWSSIFAVWLGIFAAEKRFGINISEETLVCPKRSFLCKTPLLGKRQKLSTFWRGRYCPILSTISCHAVEEPQTPSVIPAPTQHHSSHPIPLCPPKALLLLVCIASRWRSQLGVMRDAVSSVANTMSCNGHKPLHVCTLYVILCYTGTWRKLTNVQILSSFPRIAHTTRCGFWHVLICWKRIDHR